MQLVIKNGVVIATHADEQDIRGLYPDGQVVTYDGVLPMHGPLDGPVLDPRTEEQKAKVYRDQRRQAYPPLSDQLDMIYHDQIDGTTTWQDTVTAVKAQYPKV
jgi:hypothetical protein